MCDFPPIIFAREIIFVITTIILVVFSFRIRSDVDNLKELKIKTNFNLDNKIDEELNNFDFSFNQKNNLSEYLIHIIYKTKKNKKFLIWIIHPNKIFKKK